MGIAGVAYDSSAGIIEVAFRVQSTIVPLVLGGFEFYLLVIMNCTVFISQRLGYFDPTEYHVDLPWGLTGVTGSLMTFFVCFYNQHVFGRYNKLYSLTKNMMEHCLEIVSILRVQVPEKENQRKIAKLCIASCFMFFFERTWSECEGAKVSSREFKQMKSLGLLGDNEIYHLQKHCETFQGDAVPAFLVLQWAMKVMRRITPNPEERDDMLAGFYERVYRVRTSQEDVRQILDLPMPFQYFHIMNLMLMLNLVLWAYSLGCQESWWAPVIYMFVQLMFQGIRELSTALSDPFGEDEVDFPVTQWMIAVYARMYGILEDPFDITKIDLSKSGRRMVDPERVKGDTMIDVYIDVGAGGDESDCCAMFPCFGSSAGGRLDKGEEFIPRDEEDGGRPLMRRNSSLAPESDEESD